MRIYMWAATLLLAAFLPNTVQAQAGPGTATAAVVRANPVATAVLEEAGIVPCHLNFESQMASPSFPGFGKNSLVRNGGACTSDLVCASKWCVNGICKQTP